MPSLILYSFIGCTNNAELPPILHIGDIKSRMYCNVGLGNVKISKKEKKTKRKIFINSFDSYYFLVFKNFLA